MTSELAQIKKLFSVLKRATQTKFFGLQAFIWILPTINAITLFAAIAVNVKCGDHPSVPTLSATSVPSLWIEANYSAKRGQTVHAIARCAA